ncbi:probable disease resistance protein At5g66900 isoform X11 [Malus sylvestris]|uniref:probable disease resistance protein At5g66900 isoform X11 n=1 Tax=Malus sylvestris TaxID=3752 RepID=UPI0021AD1299|nr:probable disease resistance protein At5g66900 isoform X11 [Malus sylvestris]
MSGAGGLIGGAALGTAFNVLYDVHNELITKNVIFKPLLKDIKSRLDSLAPLLKDIEESNKKLDLPVVELVHLKEHLEEGIELLRKCKKIRWWIVYKRYKYATKLIGWDKSLQQFLEILNVRGIRDVKNSTVSLKNIEKLVSRIESNMRIHLAVSRETFGSVPELPRVTVGLDEPLRDLKEMLLKDDVSMLVLTATGGWGKTTLATKFCQDEEVKDKFKENIFFVTVSVHPNSDVEKLYQRMKSQEAGQDPLLLVLDDVWSNSVLQKFVELKLRNYKILVTSRSEFPGFGTPYKLKPLNYKDSMTLLRHSAALGDSLSVPEDLLREILKHCKGVPLAITVTGNSLSGQAAESWLSRLEDWRRDSILDYETKLLLCLKSSIDALGDKEAIIRECFMDLVSFPEDQRISAAAFIDMWSELYMLDGDFRSIKNLHELARKGLANLVITRNENMAILDNYYSEHFVRQHDMLRDLGIYIAKLDPIEDRKRLIVVSGRNQPKWLREQKSQPINARLLSISSDGTYPTQWQSVHLPQVEVLVLNFKTENNALPEFVQKIDKLKVLIVTNYGLSPTELSNFNLLESLSNLKRIRLESISIHSITKNWVPLKSLKKISLFMCNMGQAFHNCSIKISDAWPGLEEMNIDYCDDLVELPAELCDLVHMKVLSITNCHQLSCLPEEIGNLKKLDVLRLRSCTELVRLPVSIENLTKLRCLDMYNCFGIRKLPEGIGKMRGLRKINMGQCSRLEELPLSVWDLDEQLEEVICDEEKKPFWDSFLARDKIKVTKENSSLNWLEKPQL